MDTTTWQACGSDGAVAAAGPEPVKAALELLAAGGNAVDAAIAAILTLSVTDHGMYTLGGEIPFMVHLADGSVTKVIAAVGKAPADPRAIAWYMRHGMPDRGDVKAAPVPSTIGLCVTALTCFGRATFAQVAQPMLRQLALDRQPFHAAQRKLMERLIAAEARTNGTREHRLAAVADRFYRGDIAAELAVWYRATGSFLTQTDLANHETRIDDPVTATYRDWTVYKCGPWTQGPVLLQTLRLLEGFDPHGRQALQSDRMHIVIEALKLALADRDHYYGDPLFAEVPLDRLLSDAYTLVRRPLIDRRRASPDFRPGDPVGMRALAQSPGTPETWGAGTTTCVVADRYGNLVAATPSCNPPYHLCDSLGIPHGNRLRCLNTQAGHPNCVQAGKRPRITLTPTLAARNGVVQLAISVAGGDLQDQTSLNVLLNYVDLGMPVAEAVSYPRFATRHHEDSFQSSACCAETRVATNTVMLDARLDAGLRRNLEALGHRTCLTDDPVAMPVMLVRNPATGITHAAGDPLARRCAGAL